MRGVDAEVMDRGVELEHIGHEREQNKLLYMGDTVLIVNFQRLVSVFGDVYWRTLKVNVLKITLDSLYGV